MALTDKLTAIGDAIREKTETAELIPLSEMPVKVDDVYEAGKKAEYDKFWDAFQDNGNRTVYASAFEGKGWDASNFYPKYDIRLVGYNSNVFYAWEYLRHTDFDLAQRLEDCGVVLDTSQAKNLDLLFAYGKFSRLPTIDMTSATSASNIFSNNWHLITIDKIIVTENLPISGWFNHSPYIENLTIEGTIGQNGFNVSPCTNLTRDSLMSIINALKNFTDGTTRTVTLGATNIAKLTDAEKAIATQKGWTLA